MVSGELFLVRHASYAGNDSNPSLSDMGKTEAAYLAKRIAQVLGVVENVVVWTSPANRAYETAEIICRELKLVENAIVHDKLWSDNRHQHDFAWLKGLLEQTSVQNLIIVSHLEYVQDFPRCLGFPSNSADYAEGVRISDGKCTKFY